MIIVIAREFGNTPWDLTAYTHAPGVKNIIKGMETECYRIPVRKMLPGDLIVMQVNTPEPWHVGLKTDKGLLHANAQFRKVVEHELDDDWRRKISLVYRPRIFND